MAGGLAGKVPVIGAPVPKMTQVPAGTCTTVIESGRKGRASTSFTSAAVRPRIAFDAAMKPPAALVVPWVKTRTYCVGSEVNTAKAGVPLTKDWVGGTELR